MLKSPTLSQLARMTLMQVISTMKWDLQLGDIKHPFLEAGPINEKFRPLFAHQPAAAGGIPGVEDAVTEVCGSMDRMMHLQLGSKNLLPLLSHAGGLRVSWTSAFSPCAIEEIPPSC